MGVELAFSEAVDVSASDITLYEDESEVGDYTVQDTGFTERVFITTDSTILTGDLEVELSSNIEDADDNSLIDSDTGNNSVTFAPVTVKKDDDKNAYEGGNIAIVSESGNNKDVEIEGPNGYYFSGSTDTNSEVFVFNTSDRDLGEYDISIAGSNIDDTQLTLRDLGLELTVDDTDVTTAESIEGTVEASASDRDITVELLDSSGDTVDGSTTDATLSGQGSYDFSFDPSSSGLDLDTGNYTVHVTDDYSGVEVESSDVTVSEAGDKSADFTESVVTDQRGDTIEFTVETQQTDTATLTFGTESQGVVSNVSVEDNNGDDQVTVYLNTYSLWAVSETGSSELTESSSTSLWSVDDDSDDEVRNWDLTTNTSDLIDAGEYDLEARPDAGVSGTESTDVETVSLQDRGTTEFRTWTAPDDVSISDLEDVSEAVENGELTQSSEIANGDIVVHELQSSGLEGALGAEQTEDVTDRFYTIKDAGVYDLTVEQSEAGANQQAFEVLLNESNTTVIADGANDTYYVLFDTDEINTTRSDQDIPDDEGLTANFTVYNDNGFDFAPDDLDDDEDAETLVDYEVVEPELSVGTPYNVSDAAEQTVSGTTTLAPGTELTLRVRSTDGTSPSFLKTASPVVQSDRTWNADLDFSEQNVGDTYEIVINDGSGGADQVTEDGTVVEVVDTSTPMPEPETDTPEPDTDTATAEPDTTTAEPEPDTDTPEPDTETPTSTPGFGVFVALTALLAAALLAIRREN
ncbi:DUF7827 domain-containing protein [Halobellus marinus]|uniref:DUF7827 domain-containing protein n=1 Tax=Halobellus TaxID=1073986 RepID=UPI0028B193E4|nr:BGTF surface domain-containing protein [Halobellus sp. DFY28]